MKVSKKSAFLLGMAMLGGTITAMYEPISEYDPIKDRPIVGQPETYPRLDWYPIQPLGKRIGQSKAEIKKEFKDAERALFTNPGDWMFVLDDVYRYVEENAHGNTKLMTTAHLVKEAGSILSMMVNPPGSISVPELLKYQGKLQEKVNILNATTFYINRKDKYNAREVLMEVINFLFLHIEMIVG